VAIRQPVIITKKGGAVNIRDAVKLQTGDFIRCGPNKCGCDGSVVKVTVHCGEISGIYAYVHEGNGCPFLAYNSRTGRAYWAVSDKRKLAFARTIRRVG